MELSPEMNAALALMTPAMRTEEKLALLIELYRDECIREGTPKLEALRKCVEKVVPGGFVTRLDLCTFNGTRVVDIRIDIKHPARLVNETFAYRIDWESGAAELREHLEENERDAVISRPSALEGDQKSGVLARYTQTYQGR